jgi:hypothetical protein
MMSELKNKLLLAVAFLILIVCGASCEQAPSMRANNATPLPTAETTEKLTSLQREVRDMEGFKFILVIKRKDGGAFDGEDKKFLRENSPLEINRRVLTEDQKAFVVGSNFPFPPENLENLKKRFAIEDYSPPIAETTVNMNSNTNTNTNGK